MGLIWKVISHTKSIFNPQQDHRSCHTISILGPYVAHIIKFGKGCSSTIMAATASKDGESAQPAICLCKRAMPNTLVRNVF